MTTTMAERVLDRLRDSGLSTDDLANVPHDVSGEAIYDRFGTEIGTISDLDGTAVDRERDFVRGGPAFDDAMTEDETELHYLAVARHYDVDPYWTRVTNR